MKFEKNRFKERCTKTLPGLSFLPLTEKEWSKLFDAYRSIDRQKITRNFLIINIMKIKNISYDDLLKVLKSTSQPQRRVKRKYNKLHVQKQRYPLRKRSYRTNEPNRIIVKENQPLSSPMTKTGIKSRPVMSSDTPVKGYSQVHKTPKGTKLRPIYKRQVTNLPSITFFTPLTPEQKENKPGRVLFSSENKVKPSKPHHYKQAKPIDFIITKELYDERRGKKRPFTQTQLTGVSSKELFSHCGDKFAKQNKGQKYHWSHLIAYFLGGRQATDNIVPATASSNYNTLETVEQFIAKKLQENEDIKISVRVTPKYHQKNDLIPFEVNYQLKWKEKNSQGQLVEVKEEININPLSHQRVTQPMLNSFNIVRGDK